MTRTNLKVIMQIKGFNLTGLATKLNVSTTSVFDTIAGRMSSKRIESALEEAFDLPIDTIRKAWNTQGRPVMTPEIKAALASFTKSA